MEREENIKQELFQTFSILEENFQIRRARRIALKIDHAIFGQVIDFLYHKLRFHYLCAITGLDDGESLSFIYELSQEDGVLLSLKTSVPKKDPVLRTVTPYFRCADVYEREVVDLLGARVEGLPSGNRYPLTDDWPAGQYPLRKDWTPDLLK